MTGQRYGRLVVKNKAGRDKHRKILWWCLCDCGKETIVSGSDLRSKHTQSCGCLRTERIIEACTKHGMKNTPTYKSWEQIKQRCGNPKNKDYKYYGGRGIRICKRWMSFKNFYSDMGKKPTGLTIERIDNNGNYEQKNCKWATRKEQMRNTTRTKNITYNKETMCLNDWAIRLKINRSILCRRLKKHPIEIAFNMTKYTNTEAL